MKKLIVLLLLVATQATGQVEDSLELVQFQDWILSKEGKKVGKGVCFDFVNEFLKTIDPNWIKNWDKGGKGIQYGKKIKRKDLRPGDIVLFERRVDGGVTSHVGIFLGFTDDKSETMVLAHQNTTGNIKTSTVVFSELVDIESSYKKITYFRPLLGK